MMPRLSSSLVVAATLLLASSSSDALSTSSSSQQKGNSSIDRRQALFGILSVGTAAAALPEPAQAKYSDYARREADWESRQKSGEIKYSSARDLKAQLREIVPQNTENSRIFCPNGPSAAVSPLMENKCGDRLATPSVYGRQDDVLGNSIPGFKDGYAWSSGNGSSMSTAVGGFPTYKEGEFQVQPRFQ